MKLATQLKDNDGKDYELGDNIKCRITGFKGVFIGITQWFNDCTRIGIQSKDLHDKKPIDTQWFDVDDIVLISKSNLRSKGKLEVVTGVGGPKRQDPIRGNNP